MRSFYGVDRVDNGYFISENFSESLIERDYLFAPPTPIVPGRTLKSLAPQAPPGIMGGPTIELALLLFAPTLVSSNDFVFVLDDLHRRSKFNLASLVRLPQSPSREDLDLLFAESTRLFNVETLQ